MILMLLHFILIGHEFLDDRDDEDIKEWFIESMESVGVESALLTIYSMCSRDPRTNKIFVKEGRKPDMDHDIFLWQSVEPWRVEEKL